MKLKYGDRIFMLYDGFRQRHSLATHAYEPFEYAKSQAPKTGLGLVSAMG